jgi:hypothetical protein
MVFLLAKIQRDEDTEFLATHGYHESENGVVHVVYAVILLFLDQFNAVT